MSGVSLPVTRPVGRALVVANPTSRATLEQHLARLGFDCGGFDDPYTAATELARRRLAYTALILSLSSLYREELSFIAMVKRRFPHVEIWLAHTDGRQAALAEAMRFGADGLVDGDGLHRIAAHAPPAPAPTYTQLPEPIPAVRATSEEETPPPPQASEEPIEGIGEPVLTADELRALLQDQPAMPPSSGDET